MWATGPQPAVPGLVFKGIRKAVPCSTACFRGQDGRARCGLLVACLLYPRKCHNSELNSSGLENVCMKGKGPRKDTEFSKVEIIHVFKHPAD